MTGMLAFIIYFGKKSTIVREYWKLRIKPIFIGTLMVKEKRFILITKTLPVTVIVSQ